MTTTSDRISPAAQVTDLPPAGSHAEARTRTRESGPPAPGHVASQVAWVQRVSGTILSGESLLHRQPPSVAAVWDRHTASARHYNAWLLRWPRYLWGVIHTPLAAAVYLLSWVVSSIPLLLITTLSVFLIHQFL